MWLGGVSAIFCACAAPPGPTPEGSPAVVRESAPAPAVESWTFEGVPGYIIRTPHYRIFTTEPDAAMRWRLVLMAEEALLHYTTHLAELPLPDTRLDTFLMGRRWEWDRLTQRLMGAEAPRYLRIQRGGYAAAGRGVFYNIGLRDTLAIAAHEGWHQYTQRVFVEALPVWLEEGIACVMEGFRSDPDGRPVMLGWANVERFDELRDASARGALMPLEDVLSTTPQNLLDESPTAALTYYAQVWALVHFLREGEGGRYRASLSRVLTDAAIGRMHATTSAAVGPAEARNARLRRTGPAVFQTYFSADLREAQEQYSAFIAMIVRTGSKDHIVRGDSPIR